VLLITDTAVLTTTQRGGFLKPVAPARPASPLPGLVAISAEGEKLVLGFAVRRSRHSSIDPLKTGPRRWQS